MRIELSTPCGCFMQRMGLRMEVRRQARGEPRLLFPSPKHSTRHLSSAASYEPDGALLLRQM